MNTAFGKTTRTSHEHEQSVSDARYQVMDGPEELLGCYTEQQILTMLANGSLPDWVQILDTHTLDTRPAAERWPPQQALQQALPETGAIPPLDPAAEATMVATDSGSHAYADGQRYGTDEIPVGQQWHDLTFGQQLGKGGMGTVYRGTITEDGLDFDVAIKLLPMEAGTDEQLVERFRREAESLSAIDSEHVVRVYRHGIFHERHFIVMELVEGCSLHQRLREGYRPSWEEACRWVAEAARGLWDTGKQGLVHRDVKPANILLDKQGRVKLTDFGIARLRKSNATSLTMTGAIVGTAMYMSPEQASGGNCDHRSDIYSLGIVFYELLNGATPFQADSLAALLMQHMEEEPPPFDLPDGAPRRLPEIIRRCLAKDPNSRYQSAMDLARDIADCLLETDPAAAAMIPLDLQGGGGLRNTPPQLVPAPRRQPASKLPWIIGACCVVSLLIAFIVAPRFLSWQLAQNLKDNEDDQTTTQAADQPKRPTKATQTTTIAHTPEQKPEQAPEDPALILQRSYQQAISDQNWEEAHRLARQCKEQFPTRFATDGMSYKLHINSEPAGASVTIDGKDIGTTPCTFTYQPDQHFSVLVTLAGFAPSVQELDKRQWQQQHRLNKQRDLHWSTRLLGQLQGNPIICSDRLIVATSEGLYAVADGGRATALPMPKSQIGSQAQMRALDDHLYILGRDAMYCINPRSAQLVWKIDSNLHTDKGTFGPHLAKHELVDNNHKAYLSGGTRISSFLIHNRQGELLQESRLGDKASAGAAVVPVAIGLSTLAQPMGSTLAAFNSATVTRTAPLSPLFNVDFGQVIHVEPLPIWFRDTPAFVVCTKGGAAYLVDAREEVVSSKRLLANWHYDRSVTWTPQRIAEGSQLIAGCADESIALNDLADHGAISWSVSLRPAQLAGPPIVSKDRILVTTTAGDLIAYNISDGKERWRQSCHLPLYGSVQLMGHSLVLCSSAGLVMAIDAADR